VVFVSIDGWGHPWPLGPPAVDASQASGQFFASQLR
jgi:poly(3-hydroxybutyrate) depolymerase